MKKRMKKEKKVDNKQQRQIKYTTSNRSESDYNIKIKGIIIKLFYNNRF